VLLADAGLLEDLGAELINGEDPLGLLLGDLLEPLFSVEARVGFEDSLEELVFNEDVHVIGSDHVAALFVVVVVGDPVAELVRQLEDVLGAEAGQADEIRLEVLVVGCDLSVLLDATILQDAVKCLCLVFLLALVVEQAEAFQNIHIHMVSRCAICLMETLVKEHFCKNATGVL